MIATDIMVVGSEGNIGQCVQHGLDKLSVTYSTADILPSADNILMVKPGTKPSYRSIIEGSKLVLSCLPYHQNAILARDCVAQNIPYADLGGSVPVSQEIAAYDGRTFTDLGLAPGWVNIIAEGKLQKEGIGDVEMMVGGLPINPDKYEPLKYCATWSLDGLFNEYMDDCLIVVDGEIKSVGGMSGLASLDGDTYECFYTSGGAAHSCKSFLERGVQNCSYKTIRYQGHNALMTWLLRRLPVESVKKLIDISSEPEDKVLIRVKVGSSPMENRAIKHTKDFSAMQIATAYPFVSAALLIDEMREGSDLEYRDVPQARFNEILANLWD